MPKPGPKKKRSHRIRSSTIEGLQTAIENEDLENLVKYTEETAFLMDIARFELHRARAYALIRSGQPVSVQYLSDLCEITYAAMQRYLRARGHDGTGQVPSDLAKQAVEHYRNK